MTNTPETTAHLCAEYEVFLAYNPNVPEISADESLGEMQERLFQARESRRKLESEIASIETAIKYLHAFCIRWDLAQDMETSAAISAQTKESI